MHVILHVIVCNAVCNEWCNAVCNESYYIAYYMPLHEILHACYMTLKIWEVLHVMACNLDVITCNYMHYMSLHATEDANEIWQWYRQIHADTAVAPRPWQPGSSLNPSGAPAAAASVSSWPAGRGPARESPESPSSWCRAEAQLPGCGTGVPVSDPRTAGPLVANAEAMRGICPAGRPQWGTKRELPPAAGRGARQRRGPLKPVGFKLVAWAIHVEWHPTLESLKSSVTIHSGNHWWSRPATAGPRDIRLATRKSAARCSR